MAKIETDKFKEGYYKALELDSQLDKLESQIDNIEKMLIMIDGYYQYVETKDCDPSIIWADINEKGLTPPPISLKDGANLPEYVFYYNDKEKKTNQRKFKLMKVENVTTSLSISCEKRNIYINCNSNDTGGMKKSLQTILKNLQTELNKNITSVTTERDTLKVCDQHST